MISYKRVMRKSACIVIYRITVNNFADLFKLLLEGDSIHFGRDRIFGLLGLN